MKRALVIGATGTRGLYLCADLLDRGYAVVGGGLRGVNDNLDLLRRPQVGATIAKSEKAGMMGFSVGDVRDNGTVKQWYLSAVPDVVHFLVGVHDQVDEAEIQTRLQGLMNVLAISHMFYDKARIIVHQKADALNEGRVALNQIEATLAKECKQASVIPFIDVCAPGGHETSDGVNQILHAARKSKTAEDLLKQLLPCDGLRFTTFVTVKDWLHTVDEVTRTRMRAVEATSPVGASEVLRCLAQLEKRFSVEEIRAAAGNDPSMASFVPGDELPDEELMKVVTDCWEALPAKK